MGYRSSTPTDVLAAPRRRMAGRDAITLRARGVVLTDRVSPRAAAGVANACCRGVNFFRFPLYRDPAPSALTNHVRVSIDISNDAERATARLSGHARRVYGASRAADPQTLGGRLSRLQVGAKSAYGQ